MPRGVQVNSPRRSTQAAGMSLAGGHHRRGGHGARDRPGELADRAPAVELAGLLPQDLVHEFGSGGEHGPQFPSVHNLGGAGAGVAGNAGDLLDGYA